MVSTLPKTEPDNLSPEEISPDQPSLNLNHSLRLRNPRPHSPRPLGLHLQMAMAAWIGLPFVWPLLNASLRNSGQASSALRRMTEWLEPLKERLPPPSDKEAAAALAKALIDESLLRSRDFVSGIAAYRRHGAKRAAEDMAKAPVLWQSGTTRLLDYAPEAEPDAPVVLVIPSLINRYWILDLDERHSLLRFMAEAGLRPLVVDWGEPGEEEKAFSISDYLKRRLEPISDFIAADISPLHSVLGYCMGGLLALALQQLLSGRQETRGRVNALALLAVPWDFHAAGILPPEMFIHMATEMEPCLEDCGHLPVEAMQALFAFLQPTQAMRKFSSFANIDHGGEEARRFVLAEDWLNDGVPLASRVARECLGGWYGQNLTGNGLWTVEGQAVDPSSFGIPAFVVVPQRDRIVPPESALPLAEMMQDVTLREPPLGHIGLLASAAAPRLVWKPLVEWLIGR